MMRQTITRLILLAGVVWGAALPVAAQPDADLYGRVNALRSSLGLAPYQRNAALDAAARNHAQWMVTTGEVSHTQGDGSTPRVRAQRAGYPSSVVVENIYGGTNASPATAWTWWVNSPVHYRGITSPNHDEIGIGTATGDWGSAYVLVFGNSTGTWSLPGGAANTANTGGGTGAGAAPPPVFVVGVDAVGNIMHEIQPGDTLGDIALLYGYTWDDIAYMREINGLDEAAGRTLEIGAVFLVPPRAGTYTPTPGEPSATPTATPTPSLTPNGETTEATRTSAPTATATPSATAAPARVATGAAPLALLALPTRATTTATPSPTLLPTTTPQAVAEAGQTGDPTGFEASRVVVGERGRPAWVWALIGLQVVIVAAAAVELVRRHRN